jgi:hypothetical protein
MTSRSLLAAASLAILAAFAAPASGIAQPAREVRVDVYGDDPCPDASDPEEIVVCGRQPEEERYRIPQELRRNPEARRESSWGARAMDLEDAQRFTRPNGCSPVGSNGQTGCNQELIRQWYAERRANRGNRR